jgi:hypothetical protein
MDRRCRNEVRFLVWNVNCNSKHLSKLTGRHQAVVTAPSEIIELVVGGLGALGPKPSKWRTVKLLLVPQTQQMGHQDTQIVRTALTQTMEVQACREGARQHQGEVQFL